MNVTPHLYEQHLIRLDSLIGKQANVVDRLKCNSNTSPFILRTEMTRLFDLEDQFQHISKLYNERFAK